MIFRRCAHLVLAGLCLASMYAGRARALSAQGTLGDVIFDSQSQDDRRAPAPSVARYVSDEGETFVLDRSSPTPLLKFQESQEVLVLVPSQAARGDIIYRDDLGEPVLRVTKLGGLTLFAHGRPGGAPVALAGQAQALRLQAMSAAGLGQRLLQASIKASHAARHLIVFDAQEVTAGSESLFADAAAVAAEAVGRIAKRRDGQTLLGRFTRVLFTPGGSGAASINNGVMHVTLDTGRGLAGRPSSARILEAAAKGK